MVEPGARVDAIRVKYAAKNHIRAELAILGRISQANSETPFVWNASDSRGRNVVR